MNLQSLVIFVGVGLISGWISSQLIGGRGYGLVGDLFVGVIGTFLGGWLSGLLGITVQGVVGMVGTAAGGAILLLTVVHLVNRL